MRRKNQHGQTQGKLSSAVGLMAIALLSQQPALAHRGFDDENDPCRIRIGSEWLHFSAYTPAFTENKSYCRSIPKVGSTNLVFDYEGKKMRHASIEFEVTKEPEGTRVYYRPPGASKTGTVEGTVDFAQFGEGNYQAHVTLTENNEKVDTHIPFSVGIEGDESFGRVKKVLFTLFIGVAVGYSCYRYARSGKGDAPKQA